MKLINLDLEFIKVIIGLIEYYWVYDINHLIFKNHFMVKKIKTKKIKERENKIVFLI